MFETKGLFGIEYKHKERKLCDIVQIDIRSSDK